MDHFPISYSQFLLASGENLKKWVMWSQGTRGEGFKGSSDT